MSFVLLASKHKFFEVFGNWLILVKLRFCGNQTKLCKISMTTLIYALPPISHSDNMFHKIKLTLFHKIKLTFWSLTSSLTYKTNLHSEMLHSWWRISLNFLIKWSLTWSFLLYYKWRVMVILSTITLFKLRSNSFQCCFSSKQIWNKSNTTTILSSSNILNTPWKRLDG